MVLRQYYKGDVVASRVQVQLNREGDPSLRPLQKTTGLPLALKCRANFALQPGHFPLLEVKSDTIGALTFENKPYSVCCT